MYTTKTQAILVHKMPYSESSFILKFFTRQEGLVSFIAKGAARPKSKFRGVLDFFSVVDIIFRPGKEGGLVILNDAVVHTEFLSIKENLNKQSLANVYLEIYLRHMYGPESATPLYELLFNNLDLLNNKMVSNRDYPMYLCDFLLQFFGIMGFRPHFGSCIHCKNQLNQERYYMDFDMGGPVCDSCAKSTGYAGTKYLTEIFKWLKHLNDGGIQAGILRASIMNRAENLLLDFLKIQSSRNQTLNTYRFYRSALNI